VSGLVLVVGSPHDPHVSRVADGVKEAGVEAFIVDGLSFPEETRVTLGERLEDITVDGRRLEDVAAVYVRDLYLSPLSYGVDVKDEMEQDWHRTMVFFREKSQMLLGLLSRWSQLGIPVYNPRSTEWLQAKPAQLAVLEQAGLPVPETIWTNDPETVRRFAEGRRVIYKPVAGGAATQELGPEDLTDERLRALAGAPVTFQELLPGDNFRVYCIDDDVVATFRIVSAALDFRQNEEVLELCTLDQTVHEQCLKATQALGLRWSGIDLRAGADGGLRFLEANSSPMFLGFDARGGSDILGARVARLVEHAGR
jgi:glutathione synthase/RimK-type ligase-like ATP-grasp enzyme